jgi:hypothetical protein
MYDIQGVKVTGRHARLVQAICSPGRHSSTLVKAVFIGVKEEIKAICADVIDERNIRIESDHCPVLAPDLRFHPRIKIRKAAPFEYDMAEVFYEKVLDTTRAMIHP